MYTMRNKQHMVRDDPTRLGEVIVSHYKGCSEKSV